MVKKRIVLSNVYIIYDIILLKKVIDALATAIENNKPIEQIPKKYMIN
jgi:hypothetical protein